LTRLGYIGSYARGDWGVGRDVDLLAEVLGRGDRFAGVLATEVVWVYRR